MELLHSSQRHWTLDVDVNLASAVNWRYPCWRREVFRFCLNKTSQTKAFKYFVCDDDTEVSFRLVASAQRKANSHSCTYCCYKSVFGKCCLKLTDMLNVDVICEKGDFTAFLPYLDRIDMGFMSATNYFSHLDYVGPHWALCSLNRLYLYCFSGKV